ncbi:cytochrome c biogenesis protein CcsA, partial [Escherichia sp. TWPC-MK]
VTCIDCHMPKVQNAEGKLYTFGYGGLMVAASVALASLLRGEFDGACARICWRWALPGWSALTAGIILGSWWAYCELGWGGWWFWDPVENASLLPWLSATELPHRAAHGEVRAAYIMGEDPLQTD